MALRYACVKALDNATGICVIRELPPDQQAIVQFLERLPIRVDWCGEAVPALTQKVLMGLLRSERQQPPAALKARILAEQNQKCNMCGAIFRGD